MISKINIEEKKKIIGGRAWSPVEVAKVNNQIARLALFEGEFIWHKHDNEDELFLVCSGQIVIQLRNQQDVILNSGEIVVIPRGVEHCPKSVQASYVLMFEPQATKPGGN